MGRGRRSGKDVPDIVYLPAAGVKSDFEKLLNQFTATKNVRYENFLAMWQEMKMPLLFSGRQTDQECREFIEESMLIALKFWLPPYSFQVRIGATYLVYGIYFKQPFEPRVKIRVTLPQWKDILTFMIEIHNQKHLDLEYVFHTLRYHKAFHFVAHPTELFLSNRDSHLAKDDDEGQGQGHSKGQGQLNKGSSMQQKSIVSEILEPDNIDQLSAIHHQYHRMKCALAGTNDDKPDASLDMIQANLVQYITKQVAAHDEWRKNKAGRKGFRKRHDSGASTSETEGDSESDLGSPVKQSKKKRSRTIRSIRQDIKAKAMASVSTAVRSRRHRQVRHESDTDHSGSPVKKQPKMDFLPFALGSPLPAHPEMEEQEENGETVLDDSGILSMPTFEEFQTGTKGKKRKAPAGSKSPKVKAPKSPRSPRPAKPSKKPGPSTPNPAAIDMEARPPKSAKSPRSPRPGKPSEKPGPSAPQPEGIDVEAKGTTSPRSPRPAKSAMKPGPSAVESEVIYVEANFTASPQSPRSVKSPKKPGPSSPQPEVIYVEGKSTVSPRSPRPAKPSMKPGPSTAKSEVIDVEADFIASPQSPHPAIPSMKPVPSTAGSEAIYAEVPVTVKGGRKRSRARRKKWKPRPPPDARSGVVSQQKNLSHADVAVAEFDDVCFEHDSAPRYPAMGKGKAVKGRKAKNSMPE